MKLSALMAVGFVSVLAVMLFLPSMVSASGIDLKGYRGADYKIWIPDRAYVQSAELVIVVNYANSDLLLRVTGIEDNSTSRDNRSYFVATIAVRDCEILEIPFPDVQTTYYLTLSLNSQVVFSVSFYRPGSYLLPVRDDQWTFKPPVQFDEKKEYSQNWVDNFFATLTWQTIIVACLIVSCGAFIGISVKIASKFLVPWDFFSCGFYATLIIDAAVWRFVPFSFDRQWYIPLFVGYLLGFVLWHIPYVMPVRIDCQTKQLQIRPYVIYFPEDRNKPCVQIQTNKALLSRYLGHHHQLVADAGLNPDWEIFVKKPYWPKIIAPTIWLQKTDTKITVSKWWKFKIRDIETQWALANASVMPRYKWLVSTEAFYEATDYLDWSETERTRYALTHQYEAVRSAAAMLTHSIGVSPIEAVKAHLKAKEQPIIKDLGEHTLTEVESADLEVLQDDIEDTDIVGESEAADSDSKESEEESPKEYRKIRKQKGGRENDRRRK